MLTAFLQLRTFLNISVPTDHSLNATFPAPWMFETDVEWTLRVIHRQLRKFFRRECGRTMNRAVVLFQTFRSK